MKLLVDWLDGKLKKDNKVNRALGIVNGLCISILIYQNLTVLEGNKNIIVLLLRDVFYL